MVSEEFKTDMGKAQYIKHQKEIMDALRQLANALGVDRAYCSSESFFHDFMADFWSPFEEVTDTGNKKQSKLNKEITAYRELVETKISPEANKLLDQYVDLLGRRNGEALDYAFLVGYQSAFRFIMLGLSEPSVVLPNGVARI